MKYVFIVLSAIIISITGCSDGGAEGDFVKKSSVSSVQSVTINPKYLSTEDNTVVYSPGSDRRKSSYVKWIFSKDEFIEKVGDPDKIGAVIVRAAVVSTEEKIYS